MNLIEKASYQSNSPRIIDTLNSIRWRMNLGIGGAMIGLSRDSGFSFDRLDGRARKSRRFFLRTALSGLAGYTIGQAMDGIFPAK